jgi:type IV pilus assembly protein PilA
MTLVQKTLRNQKGLTLIELLAVIVILGIIAAIAVPAIGNVIEKSREKATVAEALNVISAAKLAQASGVGTADASGNITMAKDQLLDYVKVSKVDYISVVWTKSTGSYAFVGLVATTGNAFPTGITGTATETDLATAAQK